MGPLRVVSARHLHWNSRHVLNVHMVGLHLTSAVLAVSPQHSLYELEGCPMGAAMQRSTCVLCHCSTPLYKGPCTTHTPAEPGHPAFRSQSCVVCGVLNSLYLCAKFERIEGSDPAQVGEPCPMQGCIGLLQVAVFSRLGSLIHQGIAAAARATPMGPRLHTAAVWHGLYDFWH